MFSKSVFLENSDHPQQCMFLASCEVMKSASSVRIRLNQVKAKANYYIDCLYILNRMSLRMLRVDYGDCAMGPKHGLKQERTGMKETRRERGGRDEGNGNE